MAERLLGRPLPRCRTLLLRRYGPPLFLMLLGMLACGEIGFGGVFEVLSSFASPVQFEAGPIQDIVVWPRDC